MITYTEILINNEEVEVEIEYDFVDEGIGHYEWWGVKGYDSFIAPEITDINPTTPNSTHDKYIDDNFDSLCEMLYNKLEFEPDDEPWKEPGAWEGGFADNH